MVGSLLLLPVFTLRGGLSRNVSLFGARLGLRIVVFSTGLAMLSRVVFIVTLFIYKGVFPS
jgi:hypothetical protein